MTKSGLNLQSLRNKNRSLILYELNSGGKMSRKELAERLSLTPAAVTKICCELIDEGLIVQRGEIENSGRSGRKEILLSLSLKDKLVLAINAQRDAVSYGICDLEGTLLASEVGDLTTDTDLVIADAKRFMLTVPPRLKEKIITAAVCVIGDVNDESFGVWQGDGLCEKIEKELGLCCVIENNVKAFALAELLYSGAPVGDSVLYFKWGPGIGSAFSSGTSVLSGSDNGVTEIGHYIVDPSGEKCRCGRYGCLETVASWEKIRKSLGKFESIDEALRSNDANVTAEIDCKIDTVALALSNTATILNAKRIVLFGSMFRCDSISRKLTKQCLRYDPNLNGKIIKVSSLNEKSAYIGACAIAAKRFFFERGE